MNNGRYAGSWLWPSMCSISHHIIQLKCFCPLNFNKPRGNKAKKINSLRFQTSVMAFLLLDFIDENNVASHTLLNIIRQFYPSVCLLFGDCTPDLVSARQVLYHWPIHPARNYFPIGRCFSYNVYVSVPDSVYQDQILLFRRKKLAAILNFMD